MRTHYCILLALVLLLPCMSLKAQAQLTDSLRRQLALPQPDTTKVLILTELGFSQHLSIPDSTLYYAEKAYQLAHQMGYAHGMAMAKQRAGVAYLMKSNYTEATRSALEALTIFETQKNQLGISECYNSLANVYFMQALYDKANECYHQSLSIYRQMNNQANLARTYANMGRTALMQGKYGLALKFLDRALELAELHNLDRIKAAALNTVGDVQQKMGYIDRALTYYEQSLALSRQLGIRRIIAYSTRGMSEVYRLKGDLAKSNEYALATMELSKEVGYRENVKNAAFILSDNYSQVGNYAKALEYYKLGIAEKDSMFNAAKETEIENMRQNHELEKANREIQILQANGKLSEAEAKRSRLQIYIMVVVLVFAILFGIVLYRNFMIQKKAKQELEVKQTQLEQKTQEVEQLNSKLERKVAERTRELDLMINDLLRQNTDLEQFSYIISHNLRAPVARILGLTSIFDAAYPDSADNTFILEMIQKSAGDLDAIIKDLTYLLSVRKALNTAREWTNLHDVVQAELEHLSVEIQTAGAAIHTQFDPDPRIFAIKAYVHSILHNLLSNAIKYRHERRPLHINLSVRNTPDGVVRTVQDNGLGMSLSDPYKVFGLYQRMHTHVEGKGLGLYLVKTQVEAMSGSISVESKEGVGSTFTVSFPQVSAKNEIHNTALASTI